MEEYLDVLSETRDYFQQIIAFEREKADKGLFLSDEMADQVLEQCNAFLAMGNGNYLYSTFVSRIGELQELSEKEKSDYIQQNARQMEEQVYPAYEDLIQAVKELKGKGTNEKGLCYFPEGRKYYEWYIQQSVGVTDTIQELEQLTRRQISEDITGMEEAVNEAKQAAAILEDGKAERILEKLKKGIGTAFPEIPKTSLRIKYVPEEMQEHLSPAFYMIPAIDYTEENVIYVNQIQMRDDLALFTMLAHEGYPGHLYQTIFFESTNPDPIRSILNFGGYVEGWATYAEMCSYYLMPLSKTQAAILQKNSSVILALYALADMGIHYEGWSRMDTVEFYARYGIKDAKTVDKIYNLILGSPGNYLKYYIGYIKFLELKKEWIKSGNQSQIHGSAFYCEQMIEAYKREGADKLLLLGDILYHGPRNDLPEGYAPKEVIAMLNPMKKELLCVRGNCDTEVDQMVLEFPILADYCYLNLSGDPEEKNSDVTIFATHGHVYNPHKLPMLKDGDILLNGHTHIPACEEILDMNGGKYQYLNPGSVSIPKEGSEHSYMIYENGVFTWKNLAGEEYQTWKTVSHS